MLSLENVNILFDSMTVVLTTTITYRIILFIRGALSKRGAYAGSAISSSKRAPGPARVLTPSLLCPYCLELWHPIHCTQRS
jgi:hypothetical protein